MTETTETVLPLNTTMHGTVFHWSKCFFCVCDFKWCVCDFKWCVCMCATMYMYVHIYFMCFTFVFLKRFYLFIHERHTEAETWEEREAGSLWGV